MKRITRAAVALLAAGAAVITPGAVSAEGQSGGPWKARSFVKDGIPVSEVSNGVVTARVYGASVVGTPVVGTKQVKVEIVTPDVEDMAQPLSEKGHSAYEMSLAAGMSPKDACDFARDMDPFGCRAAADVAPRGPGVRGMAPMAQTEADFLGTICHDLVSYEGDGSKHAHGCNTRYHDAWTTNYRWIANRMKVTGWSEDPGWVHDRINGVGIQARYTASDSYATDWEPYTSESMGSCTTNTTSAQGKNGASYSTSETVCPDYLHPFHSPAFQYFGAKWTGEAAPENHRRGAVATSVHKIPRAQGYAASTYLYISWN